jgi:thiamine-phosphate pyrophosphorylase
VTGKSHVDFSLYLITDRNGCNGRDPYSVLEEALIGGTMAVQLREKDLSSCDLFILASKLRELTTRYHARLIINDRVDIALAVAADGVHLGHGSIPIQETRRLLGSGKLIGVSCHTRQEALTAQELGADFITFGPVFHTLSKAVYGDPVGLHKLAEISRLLSLPVFALGGIKRNNVQQVMAAGVHGIAMISAILAAENPRDEAAAMLSLLPTETFEYA